MAFGITVLSYLSRNKLFLRYRKVPLMGLYGWNYFQLVPGLASLRLQRNNYTDIA